jgi:hypothetical protein
MPWIQVKGRKTLTIRIQRSAVPMWTSLQSAQAQSGADQHLNVPFVDSAQNTKQTPMVLMY